MIVLFTTKDTIYKKLGADCYDIDRNALNYKGNKPVIAHPPCRAWGKLKGQAKPRPGEKELTNWALDLVNKNGGILEHPKGSDIWKIGDTSHGFKLPIQQKDFGHRARKDTILYIVGIKPNQLPKIPITLAEPETTIENMSKRNRESTPINLAIWLLKTLEKINDNN